MQGTKQSSMTTTDNLARTEREQVCEKANLNHHAAIGDGRAPRDCLLCCTSLLPFFCFEITGRSLTAVRFSPPICRCACLLRCPALCFICSGGFVSWMAMQRRKDGCSRRIGVDEDATNDVVSRSRARFPPVRHHVVRRGHKRGSWRTERGER